ncbi:MAG TPA: type II secretion system F family protein [Candidatus Obscuribacterales bacterium]
MAFLAEYPEFAVACALGFLVLVLRTVRIRPTKVGRARNCHPEPLEQSESGEGSGLAATKFFAPRAQDDGLSVQAPVLAEYILGPAGLHASERLAAPAKAMVLSLPHKYVQWLSRILLWAGLRHDTAFGDLACLKVGLALTSIVSAMFLPLMIVPPLAVATFFLPDAIVAWQARRRQQEILESLPQALDLMLLCVDAGLGLDATLQRIATEPTAIAAALNSEILALRRDILLGMERERAYQELHVRTGVDELKTLGAALNQGSRLGLGIARILRAQSEFIRTKQSQKAEERAFKLPVYMAFPLWFCIMPAFMTILLAPSLIMFFQQAGLGPGLFH